MPTQEWGVAWDLREMGSDQGKGEGGPGPPNKEGDKQSTPREEGGNMEQEEEGRTSQA